jgi:hypothetical protein
MGEVLEFAYGQPSHPSPATPFNSLSPMGVPLNPAAIVAATIKTPHNRILMNSKLRMMTKVMKRVKRKLKGMGLLKGKNEQETTI